MDLRDRFDYAAYWRILERLRGTHRIVRFADLQDDRQDASAVILRHDVDYSMPAALAMAEQEARRGIRATYFLLLNGFYYNLLEPRYAPAAARLVALGHEVGLHYDINFLRQFPDDRWIGLIELQARVLETLSGSPVVSIAMHQPGLNGIDPLRHRTRFLNAYDDRFFADATYLSDSARAWRNTAWLRLEQGPEPGLVQLVIHPINWGPTSRPRREIFDGIHSTIAAEVVAAGEHLYALIEQHAGVVEHDTALRVRAASER